MSKKKNMTPAQKASARWEEGAIVGDVTPSGEKSDHSSGEAVETASASRKAKISLEGLVGPVALIVIIAVVGFILSINQGGFA